MKLKFIITVLLITIFMLTAVSASDVSSDNLTVENQNTALAVNHDDNSILTSNNASDDLKKVSKEKAIPVDAKVKFINGVSKYKKNKYYKIKITDKKTNKPIKDLKFKFKVKISKGKYKTYALKTDKNGIAKYNLKKLKPGIHRVSISSKTHDFTENFDWIHIWKSKKTTTLKMNTQKKVNGEYMLTFYETRNNAQFPKGVYVTGDLGDTHPGFTLLKAKFFFKNKKTGKIISKTTKSDTMGVKLIKGYVPIKTKVWYGTLK